MAVGGLLGYFITISGRWVNILGYSFQTKTRKELVHFTGWPYYFNSQNFFILFNLLKNCDF